MRRAAPLILAAVACTPAGAATVCEMAADAGSGAVLLKRGDCDGRVTPASTFKIALAVMGYDSGILTGEHAPALPFQPGYPDWLPAWRQTTDPTSWIANSVVWYSQQVTRRLGMPRFRAYAAAFRYGNADVSGDPALHDGLTRAWLSSSLRIAPAEQVRFLGDLALRRLPASAEAQRLAAAITAMPDLPGGWHLHGKTGTGAPPGGDGKPDWDRAYGWFVGWAVRDGRAISFARLDQDGAKQEVSAGYRARDAMLRDLPAILDGGAEASIRRQTAQPRP